MRFDALGMQLGYGILTIGLRAWIQRRRTGSYGIASAGSIQSTGEKVVLILALAGITMMAVAVIAGWLGFEEAAPSARRGCEVAGASVYGVGAVATFLAQLAMGDSWRIGVPRDERTRLVTGGPFGWVRNPIYTSLLATEAGIALVLGNIPALLAWGCIAAALEVQVRWVEEPYLASVHGPPYVEYRGQVGRFLPWVGIG